VGIEKTIKRVVIIGIRNGKRGASGCASGRFRNDERGGGGDREKRGR